MIYMSFWKKKTSKCNKYDAVLVDLLINLCYSSCKIRKKVYDERNIKLLS